MTRMLSAIRILDLTRVTAGPWCTQLMADMGATVYKIERPGSGDDSRAAGPFVRPGAARGGSAGTTFLAANRGKQSITVDIADPRGADLVRRLAVQCDAFVENYKVGSLKKYGLDYEAIRKVNPSIVYCSVTGFGQTGPYAPRPAYDSILQAMSGLMSLCGEPDGPPMRSGAPLCDITSGYVAAINLLGALWHRRETGEGQHVDAAMIDAAVSLLPNFSIEYLATGNVPKRAGSAAPNTFPSGVWQTGDVPMMMICFTDAQYLKLCDLVGRADLAGDPRYATGVSRFRHRADLTVELTRELVKKGAGEWIALLEGLGIPASRINGIDDLYADPQVIHRKLRIDVPHAGGMVPMLRSPLNFSATPVEPRPAPELGQHTGSVLGDILGLTPAEIADLRQAGVV